MAKVLNKTETLEREILLIIRDASQPVGCGAISALLRRQGQGISEATVGRLLRDFDLAGYTDKAGFQGRTLSEEGRERLQELLHKDHHLRWGVELARAVQGHTKEQLLEVLVARRAVESELAALAAQNRREEDCRELEAIVERQRQALENRGGAAEEDVDFHALIARMAGNRVLSAAMGLIRQDTQLSPVLEYIRQHVNSLVYVDHCQVLEAVRGQRPEEARAAMSRHINNIMDDVERYWEHLAQSG